MKCCLRFLCSVALFLLGASLCFAQKQPPPDKAAEKPKEEKKPPVPEEKVVQTKHSLKIGGQEIKYTATAGTILLKLEDGTPKASIFYVAYTKDDVSDPSHRPLTFSFNGGPGSSSVWLHLGLFGPRRVQMGDAGALLPPPYKLVDNDVSLVDISDLVFIDPVSTGYSRAVPGEAPQQFHGVEEDVQSVADFIRRYTTRNKRWSSPKFLSGESYGTTRAAGLSGYLQQRYGMYLNGIVLISAILNFETAEFDHGNDLPYILFLPTYTATAWHHKKLAPELQKNLPATLREAESFATGDYAQALLLGAALPAEARAQVAEQLARYTGLAQDYLERCDLRLNIFRF